MTPGQGINVDQKGEQQPADKDRAQTAHKTDQDDQPNNNSVPG